MFEKYSRLSIAYREKGNVAYTQKSFFTAIVFYNKALSSAYTELDYAFAFANRSAVYFEMKKYDECLLNIEWAREKNYPKNKMKVLDEREEKCKIMKEKVNPEDEKKNNPWNYFKLSHPPNPKIPFIVECLTMTKTGTFGRGIYALRDLKPGDIIAIETPTINILYQSDDGRYKFCCVCLKACLLNLVPCTKTAGLSFCSLKCREGNAYKYISSPLHLISTSTTLNVLKGERIMAFGRVAHGNDLSFMKFVKDYEVDKDKKTIFDYDLSEPESKDYKKNMLNCVLGLNYRYVSVQSKEKVSRGMENFMNHMAGIIHMNCLGIQYLDLDTIRYPTPKMKTCGASVLAFGSLLNHSCDPNVQRIAIDGKVVFVVCKTIKSNGQLFINYAGDFFNNPNYMDRREKLKKFAFDCHCDACSFDYRKLIQPYDSYKSALRRPMPKTVEGCFDEFKENCKFIEEHNYNILTQPNYEFMQRNYFLLSYAAFISTFPN